MKRNLLVREVPVLVLKALESAGWVGGSLQREGLPRVLGLDAELATWQSSQSQSNKPPAPRRTRPFLGNPGRTNVEPEKKER